MWRKIRSGLGWIFAIVVGALFLPPLCHLGVVAVRDRAVSLPAVKAGYEDASRLNRARPQEVVEVLPEKTAAERQIVELVRKAAVENRMVTIAGASHSMGGHTLIAGGVVLDLRAFNHMTLADDGTLIVGAGARWRDVIPFLDERGRSVAVMQSNNDFSVGGSLSVNCHGWQHDAPPIASTVRALSVVVADGQVVRCSRTQFPSLFSHVLGGYGLFGVILEAELMTVPNEFYRAESQRVTAGEYAKVWREVAADPEAGMAYGRLSVAPSSFLEEGVIVALKRVTAERAVTNTLGEPAPTYLKRLVFRGSVGSDYGKNLRWRLEKWVGETGGAVLSRNQILHEPSEWFANRGPEMTEILHEYFVPRERLAEFVEKIRPILRRSRADLLNVIVRNVERDTDTALPYAREAVFGLVMLFHQGRDPASEAAMVALSGELIDAAQGCGGTYYLPYRLHATPAQFVHAYPQAEAFFAAKRKADTRQIFRNQFYQKYGTERLPPKYPLGL